MTTVVMAHGAFCGGWAFARFRRPFEAKGWTVLTPDLRGHGADDGPGAVAGASMSDYADDLVRACADLPERPILVGHSIGGLVCQMAARRVRPQAMVLLAPSAPWGVSGSTMEEVIAAFSAPLADPFFSGVVQPDRGVMRRYSLDRMEKPQRDAVARQLRPESARALREVLNWWLDPFMTTAAATPPCPVLCVAGGKDVVQPPATVRATALRLGASFRERPEMSHWLIGEPGWDSVAEEAIAWLEAAAVKARKRFYNSLLGALQRRADQADQGDERPGAFHDGGRQVEGAEHQG